MGSRKSLKNRWFGKIGIFSRVFWTSMLVIHAPLTVRCFFGLFHEGGVSEHLVSFIALAVSSAFFVLKLAGLRLLSAQDFDWRKTVAFCVLGALLHVLVFSPTLMENHYNLSLILSVSATLTLVLTATALVRRFARSFGGSLDARFWEAFLRAKEWILVACLPAEALLKPALIAPVSRRGPPQCPSPYRIGN